MRAKLPASVCMPLLNFGHILSNMLQRRSSKPRFFLLILPHICVAPQIAFIEHCIAADRLKAAVGAVRRLRLSDVFPDIEATYRQRTVARLVDKGLWQVAATFVGGDNALQARLGTVAMSIGTLQRLIAVAAFCVVSIYRSSPAVESWLVQPQLRCFSTAAFAAFLQC